MQGESSSGSDELERLKELQIQMARRLVFRQKGDGSIDDLMPQLRVFAHSPGGLIASSVISALEQAITDVRAKRAGVPINVLLGKAVRKRSEGTRLNSSHEWISRMPSSA